MKNGRWNRSMGRMMVAVAMGVGALAWAEDARAGDWSFSIGLNDHHGSHRRVVTRSADEVYSRRVWVEPEYVERVVAVEIPAVVETREVAVYGRRGNLVGYRTVREVIQPAYTQYQTRRVEVRRGYYKTVREHVVRTPVVRKSLVRRYSRPAVSLGFGFNKHSRHNRHHGRHYRHASHGLRVSFGH